MAFKLPQVFEIDTEVDGRRVKGSYAILLGLTVYYKGDAKNVRKPEREEDIPVVAKQVLQELARKRNQESGSVPEGLPEPIRRAAIDYLDSFDDKTAIRKLVLSFGDLQVGSESHEQVSCLLLNLLLPIVPCWGELCDDRAPIETHGRLMQWFADRTQPVDWEIAEQVAVARRNGQVIGDCDACRVEPLARAVSACAKFLHAGETAHAVDVISCAEVAQDEGCWPMHETRKFQRWLVEMALPMAYQCKLLDLDAEDG